MKKILILYAAYGGGHLSAAKSIKEYIDINYNEYETNIIDCMKYINKPIETITTGAYREMAKKAPWAWKKVYYKSEKGALSKISSSTNKLMAIKLNQLFKEYNPDIVISTHPFATQMTSYLKKKNKTNCLLATILTDFAPHEQWLIGNEYNELFFVSHAEMKKQIIQDFKVNEEKIYATGIPLSLKFSQEFNSNEVYSSFNLDKNKKIILFFGGGEFGLGKNSTLKILECIAKHTDTYQIIAISGKNKKMNESFIEIVNKTNNSDNIKVYDFINKVPELMSISDLVITKPGGLTITESLASHLPILIINPIPGQEEENAEFLEKSEVAIWLKKEDNIEEKISNLLDSPELINNMKQKTYNLSHIDSTKNICNIILNYKKN